MKKFSIERANYATDTIIEADYFQVTELGVFFYDNNSDIPHIVAFYPLKDIASIVDVPAKA